VFVAKNGLVLSPPKSNLILPGITYDVVLEIAQQLGLPLEFRDIRETEVRAADEIWVTSSSKEILAIVELDGRPVGDGKPGALFRRAWEGYQEFKRRVMRKEAVSA
jgi:D-alanine transaminase